MFFELVGHSVRDRQPRHDQYHTKPRAPAPADPARPLRGEGGVARGLRPSLPTQAGRRRRGPGACELRPTMPPHDTREESRPLGHALPNSPTSHRSFIYDSHPKIAETACHKDSSTRLTKTETGTEAACRINELRRRFVPRREGLLLEGVFLDRVGRLPCRRH